MRNIRRLSLPLLTVLIVRVSCLDSSRSGRVLSNPLGLFGHTPCQSDSDMTGLCYNELECLANGGSISGYCSPVALGACCVFKKKNCGRTVKQKISYFTNPNYPAEDKKPIACLLKERETLQLLMYLDNLPPGEYYQYSECNVDPVTRYCQPTMCATSSSTTRSSTSPPSTGSAPTTRSPSSGRRRVLLVGCVATSPGTPPSPGSSPARRSD